MEALEWMLDRLDLRPGQRMLDLGCGAGGIANYIAESRDIHVMGVDNATLAIAPVPQVSGHHADRLASIQADTNKLPLERRFDAALAIDLRY